MSDVQMVTGCALTIAVIIRRCSLTAYHFDICQSLFTAIIISFSTFFPVESLDLISTSGRKRVYVAFKVCLLGVFIVIAASVMIGTIKNKKEVPFPGATGIALFISCFVEKSPPLPLDLILVPRFGESVVASLLLMITLMLQFSQFLLRGIGYLFYRDDIKLPRAADWMLVLLRLTGLTASALYTGGVFRYWTYSQSRLKKDTSEREWSFGQIVAMVMLVAPFMSGLGILVGES